MINKELIFISWNNYCLSSSEHYKLLQIWVRKYIGDFWPSGRHRQTHCASSHNQNNNCSLKTKTTRTEQPKQTENLTVWKSDNERDKEDTFIQTGRRGRDGNQAERTQGGQEVAGGLSKAVDCRAGQARLQMADPVVPHLFAGKPGRTKEELNRPRKLGLQLGEIKPQTTD